MMFSLSPISPHRLAVPRRAPFSGEPKHGSCFRFPALPRRSIAQPDIVCCVRNFQQPETPLLVPHSQPFLVPSSGGAVPAQAATSRAAPQKTLSSSFFSGRLLFICTAAPPLLWFLGVSAVFRDRDLLMAAIP